MSADRRRLPDEVRNAAVRAWLVFSCTLIALTVATLASYAGSPLLVPALLATAAGVFGTVWGVLEVVISRQMVNERRRGPNAASPLAGARDGRRRRRAGPR